VDDGSIAVEAPHGSNFLEPFHLEHCRYVIPSVGMYHDPQGFKVNNESIGDRAEVIIVAVLHISLLGHQRRHECGILLMLPLGQCSDHAVSTRWARSAFSAA